MIRETKLKILKISLIIITTVTIIFAIGVYFLRYHVEGETNLPFEITKIIVVSSSEGIEKQNNENMWALDINQNNDVYIYIKRNENYGKTEIIEKITLNNFKITQNPEKGQLEIYKPTEEEVQMFNNIEENKVTEITYTGELESNVKKMQISNQGGLVIFRCANSRIGEYISNTGDEVNYSTLLKNTEITNEQLRGTIEFDILINLVSKKTYKATATIEMPVGDIINNQTANLEITDLRDIVFKRIEN